MFQPHTFRDGVLGAAQPGAYADGTLGVLSQPGAYREGTLGAAGQVYNDGTLGDFRPSPSVYRGPSAADLARQGTANAASAAAAAARAAAARSAATQRPIAQCRQRCALMHDPAQCTIWCLLRSRAGVSGLGFAMSDVPTWGWILGGVAAVGAVVYLTKK